MSAYVVDREHIRYLVNAADAMAGPHSHLAWTWGVNREKETYERGELRIGDHAEQVRVGQMLWNENVTSVCRRYPDCINAKGVEALPGPINEGYLYENHTYDFRPVDPVQVLKACDCYAYQSCEHDGWENSEAYGFIKSLRSMATYRLPGYDDAEWGAPVPAQPDSVEAARLKRCEGPC